MVKVPNFSHKRNKQPLLNKLSRKTSVLHFRIIQ